MINYEQIKILAYKRALGWNISYSDISSCVLYTRFSRENKRQQLVGEALDLYRRLIRQNGIYPTGKYESKRAR